VNDSPDPGWRDADRSRGLDYMVAALDHFDTWLPLVNTRRVLYRALRPRSGARILDAGCGTGLDVATLASRVEPGGAVHGMDLSVRMVALAQERHCRTPGVSFSAGSVSQIPFPDGHFDATFAMRALQYLEDALPAVSEMARVTRSGGRVAVVEGGMSVIDLPSPELADRILGEHWGARSSGFGTTLYGLLRRAGLKRVRVLPVTTVEHEADSYMLDHARKAAKGAAEAGVASAEEASEWLRQVEARVASGDLFSAECFFIAIGTVAKRADL
jgi:SAM-dependent methyltransferase